MKKMRIRIGKDGKTTIRVDGAHGKECLTFTKAVEQALGAVESREMLEAAEHDELVTLDEDVSESESL